MKAIAVLMRVPLGRGCHLRSPSNVYTARPGGDAGSHRFLERQYSPNEFLPFGGGNRRCIGYALALLEMKLVLATVLTNWDLSLNSDRPILPKRRGATIAPHNGVPLTLNGRRSKTKKGVASIMR